jgi:hypothetical protein
MEKLLKTVAAITHILGREPDQVYDGSVYWNPEGDHERLPLVVIENETDPLLRNSDEPVSVKSNFDDLEIERHSKVAGYAVIGFCMREGIKCTEINSVKVDPPMDLDSIRADLENALAVVRRVLAP